MIARPFRRSLALRLSAAFLALSVGTVLLATFVSYRYAERTLRERLLERLSTFAAEDASQLAAWHYRQRAAIEILATLGGTRAAALTPEGGANGARGLMLLDPALFAAREVSLLTVPGGRVIRSSNRERLDTYAVDQLYYQEGSRRTFAQTLYPSGETGRPTMTVATPVFGADSGVNAVLAAHLDLTEMERVLEKPKGEVPLDVYVVNRFAEFVAADRFGSAEYLRGVHSAAIDDALAGGLGNVDLARSALDDPEEVRVALEQIAAATRRAAELTRQMLAYAGRASLRSEATDLRPVLYDMVALVRAAHSKKITITVAPMDEPLWVAIDPAQLSQVALNLLTNAAEAIGDAEGTITLRAAPGTPPTSAEPRETPAAGWIHLQVTDTGSGISDEVRRRIFDPFFSTKASGRGLGLSAVTGIIRSTNGILEVESHEGRATTFDVYFPATAAPAAADGKRADTAPGAKRGTILVVDDEAALRRVCRRTLEPVGFTVLEAEDGIVGLDLCRARGTEIDLVLLDLTMPRMGGAEVLAILRAERPDLPVVIASGYDRADRRSDLPNDRRIRYLQKPYGTAALIAAVTGLLE